MNSLIVCSRSAAAILIALTSWRGSRTCSGMWSTFGVGAVFDARAGVEACGVICGASTRDGVSATALGMGLSSVVCMQA